MVSGHRGRKATRRDLPVFLLVYGVMFGLAALLMALAARLDFPDPGNLKPIAGVVERNPRMKTGRGAAIIIPIQTANGVYDLQETDFTHAHELLGLKPGDHVSALVTTLGGYQVWQLERNGVILERYEEKLRWHENAIVRTKTLGVWAGTASLAFLVMALLLRKHFGAWRDKRTPSPVESQVTSSIS